jgi:hypothetical protein
LVYFKSETDRLAAINRDLTLSEPVMRHLTTVVEALPEDLDAPEKPFDAAAVSVEDLTGPAPQKKEAEGADEAVLASAGDAGDSDAEDSDAAMGGDEDETETATETAAVREET